MNILCLGAHHDDIELGCGGTAIKWSKEGHNVYSMVLTESAFKDPEGKVVRSLSELEKDSCHAAEILGVKNVPCQNPVPVFELRNNEQVRFQIMDAIKRYNIDTLLFPWDGDPHIDHAELGSASIMCGKKLPRLLMYKIEFYNSSGQFNPTVYVDISESFEDKLKAVRAYRTEYARSGSMWEVWLRNMHRNDGIKTGVEYAEAFQVVHFLIP